MSDKKFQSKYRIKSARAIWHDYNEGSYFITICTKNCGHIFGEIKSGMMQLSEIGKYTFENLQNINIKYPYAEIPLFVVMPNHIHAIVFITDDKTPYMRRAAATAVETGRAPSSIRTPSPAHPPADISRTVPDILFNKEAGHVKNTGHAKETGHARETGHAPSLRGEIPIFRRMQQIDSYKGWLSVAIGGVKSAVTKFAHGNGADFTWQTRFHDHIIRDQNEMNRIADYVENNPATWDTDCFNQ